MNHRNEKSRYGKRQAEAGIGLVEVLVSISLIAVLGLGVAMSIITSLRVQKYAEVHQAASNLAIDKIEEYSSIKAEDLDDSDDSLESSVAVAGMNLTFTRVSDITVNADNSRTIDVSVTCNNSLFNGIVSYSTNFAVWE